MLSDMSQLPHCRRHYFIYNFNPLKQSLLGTPVASIKNALRYGSSPHEQARLRFDAPPTPGFNASGAETISASLPSLHAPMTEKNA